MHRCVSGNGAEERSVSTKNERPIRLFWWAYVASAIITTGCVCIFAVFKSLIHAVCPTDASQQSFSSNQSQSITASLAWAAAAVVVNSAFLVVRSRDKQGLGLAAAICEKWQPAYFLIVSIEKIVFLAVGDAGNITDNSASCAFSLFQHDQILATELLMTAALLLFFLSSICCDYDPGFTPSMRRCSYFAAALCFVLDLMFSFVWGSLGTASVQSHVSLGPFAVDISSQIASCIAAQAVILLHLLYVSWRSLEGRGWAYTSLRFELVKKHSVAAPSNAPSCSPNISSVNSISSVKTSLETMQVQDSQDHARSNAFSRLWHRLLQFRARRLLRSQVFAIPCAQVVETGLATALCASAPPGLELERPLFRIKFPKVIIRFAELHGSLYACVVASVGLASLICNQYESTHVAMLVLNILVLYGLLGFFSCRRHNIDSVAAKHVATSFRFVSLLVLLLFLFALEIRLSCINQQSPQAVAAYTIMMMMFILCLLVDCCPNFPPIVQTAISVRKWPIMKPFVKNL